MASAPTIPYCEITEEEDKQKIIELLKKNRNAVANKNYDQLLGEPTSFKVPEKFKPSDPEKPVQEPDKVRDFASMLLKQSTLAEKVVTPQLNKSGSGIDLTLPKFKDHLEETFIRIEMNDIIIKTLLSQFELLDAYFNIIYKDLQGADGLADLMKSIGMGAYQTNPTNEIVDFLTNADELKSKYKLYSEILKGNAKSIERKE